MASDAPGPHHDWLDDDAGPIVMLKIDVEGFEMRVLRGMRRLIETHRPVIVTEVVESHLRRDGATRKDLVDFLSGLGYAPYNLTQQKSGLHHRLKLEPILNPDGTPHTDFVWLNSEGGPSSRLDAHRRPGA